MSPRTKAVISSPASFHAPSEPGIRGYYAFPLSVTSDPLMWLRAGGTECPSAGSTRSHEATVRSMTSPLSVLIVDDERHILSALGRILRASGVRLRTAMSGEEAVPLIEAEAPDLVISDFRLGTGMNGAAFLRRVAALHPKARLILHTGNLADPEVGTSGFEVWEKPCSSAALTDLVRELATGAGA